MSQSFLCIDDVFSKPARTTEMLVPLLFASRFWIPIVAPSNTFNFVVRRPSIQYMMALAQVDALFFATAITLRIDVDRASDH